MRFYSLSDNPNKPCYIVQFKQVSIMLDCGMDTSTFTHFLPLPVVEKQQPAPLHNPELVDTDLRDVGQMHYTMVDSEPEVRIEIF